MLLDFVIGTLITLLRKDNMKRLNLTLQQIADEQGITRQAVWLKTSKGKAYQKAYQKRVFVPVAKLSSNAFSKVT